MRHTDNGMGVYQFNDEQWVKCIKCGQAGIVQNHRFACLHCGLILQNDDKHRYWFGECELYADGRCYYCGGKYNFREAHTKLTGNVRGFKTTKVISCQFCQKDNAIEPSICKMAEYGYDNYFGMPLLLTAKFKDKLFWAYNGEHLAELKAFIGAELRERPEFGWSNSSMISRLPLWIKSAKNRDELLKVIDKLEKIPKPN